MRQCVGVRMAPVMEETKYIGQHVQFGNRKLPETTVIWNCGAARDCPSRDLGLCQAGKHCFARNSERYQNWSLSFRRRQHQIMRTVPAETIAEGILNRCKGRKTTVKLFRFGQSGDPLDQKDITTLTVICKVLSDNGIGCYGFTARTDLDLIPLLKVASVCVSNDKYGWLKKGANRFRIVAHPTGKNHVCPKDCTICDACSRLKGCIIETTRDWASQMTFNDIINNYERSWE